MPEREHGGRSGRADIPAKRPTPDPRPGDEGELLRTDRESLDRAAAQLGARPHRRDVLRSQPGLLPARPRVEQVKGASQEAGERDGEAHDGPAAGLLGAIKMDHSHR